MQPKVLKCALKTHTEINPFIILYKILCQLHYPVHLPLIILKLLRWKKNYVWTKKIRIHNIDKFTLPSVAKLSKSRMYSYDLRTLPIYFFSFGIFNTHLIHVQMKYKWTMDKQSLIELQTATANCQKKINYRTLLQEQYIFFPWCNSLLIIEASQSHSETPHSVGLLCTSDQPDAETSTWQHTTLTRDRHPCPWRNSNPQYQQARGRRPTP